MTAPILAVRAVEAGYTAPVVGPVSFDVHTGEVVGLAGPNGAGKSTLLRAIAGHARVFAGGIDRADSLTIAWMEQQPTRLDEMPFDGHDYLRFARASAANAPPHLLAWLDQRVDSLSGGQFQLLSCWTVLGNDAALVMLDEPTNNLDIVSEKALQSYLSGEHGGRAILLVSHDHGFLKSVCDQVVEVGDYGA